MCGRSPSFSSSPLTVKVRIVVFCYAYYGNPNTVPQVAITLVYRYQPRAGAPIDAGKSVADNGKVGDYRYYLYCLNLNLSL